MAGSFNYYSDPFVTAPFPGEATGRGERGDYMTGPMYGSENLFVDTASLHVPPIITTPAGEDEQYSPYMYSDPSVSPNCTPSPYSAQASYNPVPGYRGRTDPMLSDPESPHSASGSEYGPSPVNMSPSDNFLLPISNTRSGTRPRSSSDSRPNTSQDQGYSNNLLAPQPHPGHRRTHSDITSNPQMYAQYPGGSSALYGPSLHPESPFGTYRGRPLSRASSNASSRSSRRPSPYGSVTSSPGGGNSDLDLPLVNIKLKEEEYTQGLHPTPGINVARPQVTTPAIAQASIRRREKAAPYACPICGSTFTRKANLDGHLTAHKGERPHKCEWQGCGKGFARLNDLKRHQKIHDREMQRDGAASA